MTPYHFDNQNKKKNISRTKWIAGIFSTIIFVLLVIFVFAPLIKNISRGPAWARNTLAQFADTTISLMTPKKVLIAKINLLENQIQTDDANLVQMNDIQNQNTALRTELSYLKNPTSVIAAQILDATSESLYSDLLLDQGTSSGIKIGQLVTVQGSIGLGTIASASANTATVQLFSGPQFSGDVLMKPENITVPAIGQGGGSFEIHIPQSIVVSNGDTISFPSSPDITIGIVESISADPRDPFQTVLARTPVNVQQTRFVEVVK